MPSPLWPSLPYDAWRETYATLHMWSQVVGKVALALTPPVNHGWGIALRVTARGLATPLLPHGSRAFTMTFDFIAHELVMPHRADQLVFGHELTGSSDELVEHAERLGPELDGVGIFPETQVHPVKGERMEVNATFVRHVRLRA